MNGETTAPQTTLQSVADGEVAAKPAPKTDGRKTIPRGPNGKFLSKNGKINGASGDATTPKSRKWLWIISGVAAFFGVTYMLSARKRDTENQENESSGTSFDLRGV